MAKKLSWQTAAKRKIEKYFLTRKTGRISWKKNSEEYKEKIGEGADWELEKKRRQNYGKYIQKKRFQKYRQIKDLMDQMKKTELEEEENESQGKKWKEYRRKYLKLSWNKNLQKLQWVEDWKEKKVNKWTWKKY